jgi:hypothetical protein
MNESNHQSAVESILSQIADFDTVAGKSRRVPGVLLLTEQQKAPDDAGAYAG